MAPTEFYSNRHTLSLHVALPVSITEWADFGLRRADQQDISVLGPLAIAMQHAPTVAAALNIISRYLFVHSRGMALSVHADSELVPGAVEVRFEQIGRASWRERGCQYV